MDDWPRPFTRCRSAARPACRTERTEHAHNTGIQAWFWVVLTPMLRVAMDVLKLKRTMPVSVSITVAWQGTLDLINQSVINQYISTTGLAFWSKFDRVTGRQFNYDYDERTSEKNKMMKKSY